MRYDELPIIIYISYTWLVKETIIATCYADFPIIYRSTYHSGMRIPWLIRVDVDYLNSWVGVFRDRFFPLLNFTFQSGHWLKEILNISHRWLKVQWLSFYECDDRVTLNIALSTDILIDTVKQNLEDPSRIISIGKLPILLPGPIIAGKTLNWICCHEKWKPLLENQ